MCLFWGVGNPCPWNCCKTNKHFLKGLGFEVKVEGLMVFQMHLNSSRASGSCRMFSLTVIQFSGCFFPLICSILENFKPKHLFWSAVLLSGQQVFFVVVVLILEFAYFFLIIPRCFVSPPSTLLFLILVIVQAPGGLLAYFSPFGSPCTALTKNSTFALCPSFNRLGSKFVKDLGDEGKMVGSNFYLQVNMILLGTIVSAHRGS